MTEEEETEVDQQHEVSKLRSSAVERSPDVDDEDATGSNSAVNQTCESTGKITQEASTTLSEPRFHDGVYAPSGFDMMQILTKVATRPNPKISLGAVDSDCALILCDTFGRDTPIVYCSNAFEMLTGYQKHEILGRNCRFLQSPYGTRDLQRNAAQSPTKNDDGKQRPDDHQHLSCLKTGVARKEETQVVITNYKKGGVPFQNFLTIVPLHWNPEAELKSDQQRYIVGFQVDLATCVGE